MDVPQGFETFHQLIGQLTDKHDLARVFDDWLEYIIHFCTIGDPVPWEKSYSKDETKIFWQMYLEKMKVLNHKFTSDKSWFDFPGTYYEPCVSTAYQREKAGQFFTPPDICNMLTQVNIDNRVDGRIRISDPTAGSGRCLLSAHVYRENCFMVAEDLDHTCCLMAVVNFLFHGVDGLVIWHNTINNDFYTAWRVNESMTRTMGMPHCRILSKSECAQIFLMDEIMSVDPMCEVIIRSPRQTEQTTLEGFLG